MSENLATANNQFIEVSEQIYIEPVEVTYTAGTNVTITNYVISSKDTPLQNQADRTGRSLDYLWKKSKGIIYDTEVVNGTNYKVSVPSGAMDYAESQMIGGKCQKFNQLCTISNTTSMGLTVTANENGSVTINGTSTSSGHLRVSSTFSITNNHKYLSCISKNLSDISSDIYVHSTYNSVCGSLVTGGEIKTNTTTNATTYMQLYVVSDLSFDNFTFFLNVFDLTAMFGAGNEPSTVADFRAMFPNSYYAYDLGSIKESPVDKLVSKGINQWDEVWEIGNWGTSAGEKGSLTDRIRCKSHIKVTPNTRYYIKGSATYSGKMCAYDINKTFLGTITNTGEIIENVNFKTNKFLDIPSNVHYITFNFLTDYGTTYNNDISINYPSTDHDYHPYFNHELNIPSQIQALDGYGWGINNTCYNYVDMVEKKFHKKVVKGVYDGTENWRKLIMGADNDSYFALTIGAKGTIIDDVCISNIYAQTMISGNNENIGFSVINSSGYNDARILVRPNDVANVTLAQFKTSLGTNNLIVYYELATEVVTDISQYLTGDDYDIIQVEAGGSITFHYDDLDDGFGINVPSTTEIMVEVSEVQ